MQATLQETQIANPVVVSRAEWLAACKQLVAKEREFMRQQDARNAERRALPWVKIEKEYVFDGAAPPTNKQR